MLSAAANAWTTTIYFHTLLDDLHCIVDCGGVTVSTFVTRTGALAFDLGVS